MPETEVIQESPKLIRLLRNSFLLAGQDGYTKPPAQSSDLFELIENWLLSIDGPMRKRWGMTLFDDASTPASIGARVISEYRNDAGTTIRLMLSGLDGATRKVKTCDASGLVKNTSVWTVSGSDTPRNALSRSDAYFATGHADDRIKYSGHDTSGSGVTTWGLLAPTTAPAASASGTGSITITAFRDYCVAFKNTTTGHISDFGPFIRVEKFSNKAQVDLTSVPVADTTIGGVNTGVNQRLVLATSDGGARTRLYLVGTIGDNTTTTFTDSVTEATLLTKDVYVEKGTDGLNHGIIDNGRPPSTGKYPTKHRGRIFMLDGRKLRFSKNLDDISTSSGFELGGRFEEAWPPDYEMDVPARIQDPVGLLSDGSYLYILGKGGLGKLTGDGPLTFRPIELIFQYVGIQSQDAIDVIYLQGEPIGLFWITPDRQLIFSDGSTYRNVTWAMKPEADAIPVANLNNVRVKFGSYEGHNLIFVAAPESSYATPTLLLVYNVDTGQWGRWRLPATQEVTAMHFWLNPTTNLPQILWSNDDETMFQFDSAATQDRTSANVAASFTSTLTSSWLNFGASHIRKMLQEMEVDGSTANIAVTIYGASKASEFDSPTTIISSSTPTAGPLGEDKVYLADISSDARNHKIKFVVSANIASSTAVLRSFSLQAIPFHSL